MLGLAQALADHLAKQVIVRPSQSGMRMLVRALRLPFGERLNTLPSQAECADRLACAQQRYKPAAN